MSVTWPGQLCVNHALTVPFHYTVLSLRSFLVWTICSSALSQQMDRNGFQVNIASEAASTLISAAAVCLLSRYALALLTATQCQLRSSHCNTQKCFLYKLMLHLHLYTLWQTVVSHKVHMVQIQSTDTATYDLMAVV